LSALLYSGALAAGYWLDTAHLTSAGYDQLGKMAAAAFVYGSTRNALIDPVRATLRPEVIARTTLRNLIVGGDFTTNPWQRGTSFVSAPNGQFTADRWRWTQTGSGVVDVTKAADAPTITQAGVFTQHCLDIAVTTADASIAATDQYFIRQILEGLSTSFLGFGQSNARPITVSFWVKSTKTGTFWLSLRPASGTRSYVASYAINANNIWEYKRVTIAGDVTGTWLYDTGHGISVTWLLAAGSNFVSTANAWSAGNFLAGADPNANAMDTVDNHFKLALVQVEEGVGASPFEVLPQDVVLDRCRRHYRKSFPQATAPAQNVGSTVGATFVVSDVASAVFGTRVEFDTSMRAAPTITTYNPSAANANWRDTTNSADRTVTVSDQSESGFVVTGAAGAAGASNYIHWQASADL
jgi:hypothetical protein